MMSGSKRREVTTWLKKLYNKEPQSVPFTKCYSGHQIEEDEMGREHCMQENYKQTSELEGNKLFKRPSVGERKIFKIYSKEGVNWIQLLMIGFHGGSLWRR